MATKKPAAKAAAAPATKTAVAVKSAAAVVDINAIRAELARKAAEMSSRVMPASGNKVQITQDKKFKFPDGTETDQPFRAVIVDFVATHNYYEGAFNAKNIVPPNCFAIGQIPTQMFPSANAPDKQHDNCQTCPQNQYESSPTGSGKACKNGRRLAILPPGADMDTPMWILDVSPTALKSFDGMVATAVAKFNVPPLGVEVTIDMNPSVTYASLRFTEPEPNENIAVAYSRQDEATTMLKAEPDVSSFQKADPKGKKVARR